MKRPLLLLLLSFALAAPAGARVVLLRPGPEGEDVPPYSFLPSARRPNNETQWAFHAISEESGFDHAFETFLKFAMPPDLLQPGEVVTQAVFWIFFVKFPIPPIAGEGGGAGPGQLWCHEVLAPWSEATLTWNNKPAYGPAFDGFGSVVNEGLIWCNVTALVSDWVSGARPNNGIALSNPTDYLISFYSMETPPDLVDPSFRPSLAIEITASAQADFDDDAVADVEDDCFQRFNPDQRDTDQDGYGNVCDPDLDGSGSVGIADYGEFLSSLGRNAGQPGYDPDADFDGNGAVGLSDYGELLTKFGQEPGPSGLACAGTPPCP